MYSNFKERAIGTTSHLMCHVGSMSGVVHVACSLPLALNMYCSAGQQKMLLLTVHNQQKADCTQHGCFRLQSM